MHLFSSLDGVDDGLVPLLLILHFSIFNAGTKVQKKSLISTLGDCALFLNDAKGKD